MFEVYVVVISCNSHTPGSWIDSAFMLESDAGVRVTSVRNSLPSGHTVKAIPVTVWSQIGISFPGPQGEVLEIVAPRVKRKYTRRDPQGISIRRKSADRPHHDSAQPWPVDHLIELAVQEKARTMEEVVDEVLRTRPNADKRTLVAKVRSWILSKRLIQETNLLLYLPDKADAAP